MRQVFFLLAVCVVAVMAACGASSDEDVRQWMVEERNQARPRVTPLPAPKQFKPEAYTNATAIEPFSSLKLAQALKRDATQVASNGALVAPELQRRKEPMEAFPLDTMVMVGSIIKAGQPMALIKADNLLYQVKPGNHLGLNYGRVTRITETEVTLREIVQDAAGEWVERTATLQLQERSK